MLATKRDTLPLPGTAILITTVPKPGHGVLGTLTLQSGVRDRLRHDTKNFDDINPGYDGAKMVLRPEDVDKTLTYLGPVLDKKGREIVNTKGQVIATLTGEKWSTKRDITLEVSEQLSSDYGVIILPMCAEVFSNLATEALRQRDKIALELLDYTELVGTPPFRAGGNTQYAYGHTYVRHRKVGLYLDGDSSGPNYATRLYLLG